MFSKGFCTPVHQKSSLCGKWLKFNGLPSGQSASGHKVEYTDETSDSGGAAVGSEDIKLETQFTPLELMILVKGVLSETLVRNIGATYQFNLSGQNGGIFFIDLKNGNISSFYYLC